jgi:hypothetical protein
MAWLLRRKIQNLEGRFTYFFGFVVQFTTEPVRSPRKYEKMRGVTLPISHLLSDLIGSVVIYATTPIFLLTYFIFYRIIFEN